MKKLFLLTVGLTLLISISPIIYACGSTTSSCYSHSRDCGYGSSCGDYVESCGSTTSCASDRWDAQRSYGSEAGCDCDCADFGYRYNDCISKCEYCEAFGNIGAR